MNWEEFTETTTVLAKRMSENGATMVSETMSRGYLAGQWVVRKENGSVEILDHKDFEKRFKPVKPVGQQVIST